MAMISNKIAFEASRRNTTTVEKICTTRPDMEYEYHISLLEKKTIVANRAPVFSDELNSSGS